MRSVSKKTLLFFIITLAAAVACLVAGIVKTAAYNSKIRSKSLEGAALFNSAGDDTQDITVTAAARSSTWGKIFDFNNEGITENNYQAFTYDFPVKNNTKDEVASFTFKLTFGNEVFLASAWNGALEIHQDVAGKNLVGTIPDLRDYDPSLYDLNIVTVDGESFISMEKGDFLVYHPSTSANAMEMPIKPYEGTVPGIILYVKNGENIGSSSLDIEYRLNRLLTAEPLFWVSIGISAIWLVALIIFAVSSAQIKKYRIRHEHDNKIINESIETFTGFIDAKDPYTNGHSKRVATYTRLIAKQFGYEGEELDRIYYVALLHDCGKIAIPDNILGKPGKLTDEEFEIIKSHTVRGSDILSRFSSLNNVGEGARYHHERYDGKGYPEGKSGEDIPFIARMICVADSYDAMNTDRVYRKKLSRERIISEIENNRGLQFDPKVADVMLDLIKNGKI